MDDVKIDDSSHHFRDVAVGFDGTLTQGGRPSEDVLAALRGAREGGFRIVLVTGRIVTELRSVFPDVDGHVDAVVAENGAVLVTGSSGRRLGPPVSGALVAALTERGIAARQGDVLVACAGTDDHAVLEEVRQLGLECQLVRNRGELMILPSGINKTSASMNTARRSASPRRS